MEKNLRPGQPVSVTDAWGRNLLRKVVAVSGQKVWVCKPEEFEKARRERREPVCVGFPREAVNRGAL